MVRSGPKPIRHHSYPNPASLTPEDLMSFMAPGPEVVNTSDQVPEAFDSIAATFGFEHHVGTDATLELKVIKCILRRETLLSRVRSMVGKLLKDMQRESMMGAGTMLPYTLQQQHAGVLDCLTLVREATADTIEAVVLWREGLPVYPPPAFIWEGRNYLLKMHADLDFLADAQPLVTALRVASEKLRGNPLMLSETLRRQEAEWENLGSEEGSRDREDGEKARLNTLGKVLIMESRFEAERRQHANQAGHTGQGPERLALETQRVYSHSAPDPNLWRKKVNVFNWFDQAQGQLKSLRRSMDQGQVVLRALDDRVSAAKVQCNLPPPPLADDGSVLGPGPLPSHTQSSHLHDRLVPLAAKAPNPAAPQFSNEMETAPDGQTYRHPLEEVDLRWGGSPPYPVPFTREMNQALISKADKRIKKLPPRSFLPKSLSKVQARYLEPARRPMTPSEYEQAQQAERQRAEKGGSKRATGGGRAGGDEGEGRFAVASMQDPFGLGESRDEKKEEAEGGKDAATVKTKRRSRSEKKAGSLEDISLDDDVDFAPPKAAVAKLTPKTLASSITHDDLTQLGLLREPPKSLAVAGAAVLILLAPGHEVPSNVTWPSFQAQLSSKEEFLRSLVAFDSQHVPHFKTRALRNFVTCGADMLPAALLERSPAAAKISAWVFQVLLQQSDFVKHTAKPSTRAARASIRRVFEAANKPTTTPPNAPSEPQVASAVAKEQPAAPATAAPQASVPPPAQQPSAPVPPSHTVLYYAPHTLNDRAVFVSITQSPSGEKQIKVYEPLSSQELRAVVDVCPPAPSASQGPKGSALEAWVIAHLEQLALSTSWGGKERLQPIKEPLAA